MKRLDNITNKKSSLRFLLISYILGIAGCATAVPIDLKSVCQAVNENKFIAVEGYLTAGTSVLCSSSQGKRTCGLELVDKPGGTNKLSVYVEEGTGKSQMDPLPKSYGKESLKIRDADGKEFGPNDKVRISGIAKVGNDVASSSYSLCYLNIEDIVRP